VTIDEHNGISLTGSQCKPPRATVVDNGPVAYFAGAARDERSATVRVRVSHEKFLAAGVFDIDDWVGLSVDGPEIALPAKGVEPVFVTARFIGLPTGPHRVHP
jgi:hypothetical protein